MGAPKGNQFWKLRAKHGRDRIFKTPESLWNACLEYFDAVENNPLYEDNVNWYQGTPNHEPVAKRRPMTLWGLYTFLGIVESTWAEYRKLNDFSGVISGVEDVIKNQKLEGAMAGFFNANIVARDLGLRDKQEVDIPNGIKVSINKKRFDGGVDSGTDD